jgi:hypothetical protein
VVAEHPSSAIPPIGAAEDQNGNQLLEDHPVGNARAMAADGVIRLVYGQQGLKLLPDGLLVMYGGTAGMETLLRFG